jgi:acyl-CoA synthetase (AMP-forming)/AMP-acid ligase II
MNLSNSADNLYETLVNTASTWPHNLAVVDEYGELTYAELYQHAERLKEYLRSVNVQPGSGLALSTKNSRYFVIGLYAALGCDCVVMPVAHYQKPDEIRKALDEARIHFILSDTQEVAALASSVRPIALFRHGLYFGETGFSSEEKTVSFISNAAVMRFTSGTTGDAKCIILTHQSVLERMAAANQGLQLCEQDRVVWVLPMAYHFIVSIMLYVRYGCGIIICDDFLAERILDKIIGYKGTLLYASPLHIKLLALSKSDFHLPELKRVISTTTAISPALCKAFEEKYKLPVSQAFGIIEVGLPIINLRHSSDHPEAVGFALPAFTISILADDLTSLPFGQTGQLALKGPGMFDGYLSPPTPRAAVLKAGWFLTGDLASMTAEGLIEIKGRTKNVINVSGNKVFPAEVEEVVNRFSGVVRSKVYSFKHLLMGEIVVADVVLDDASNFDQEELIRHCRESLSSFKIPQRITVVDHIEMTASGKIKRA